MDGVLLLLLLLLLTVPLTVPLLLLFCCCRRCVCLCCWSYRNQTLVYFLVCTLLLRSVEMVPHTPFNLGFPKMDNTVRK